MQVLYLNGAPCLTTQCLWAGTPLMIFKKSIWAILSFCENQPAWRCWSKKHMKNARKHKTYRVRIKVWNPEKTEKLKPNGPHRVTSTSGMVDFGGWMLVVRFFFGDIQKSSQQKFPMTKTRCLLQFSENTRLLLVQWWARAANRYSKRHDGQAWIQANRCGQADLGRAKSCWNMLRSGWAIVRIREAKVTRWPETC